MDIPLPLNKLNVTSSVLDASSTDASKEMNYVVLVANGSFNPPTYMHLRMFELARDALISKGYHVIGGYLSPVNDAYKKKGLVSAEHRIQMCQLACKSSNFIMVDTWESQFEFTIGSKGLRAFVSLIVIYPGTRNSIEQRVLGDGSSMELLAPFLRLTYGPYAWLTTYGSGGDSNGAKQVAYQRTLTVLSRVRSFICEKGIVSPGSFRVMLVCGSDLLESFASPGVWIPEQVEAICRDFGVACIRREGQDVEQIISSNAILTNNKSNIMIVDELISNQISSTRLRDCISRGLSVKYLTPDEVIDYIENQALYLQQSNTST